MTKRNKNPFSFTSAVSPMFQDFIFLRIVFLGMFFRVSELALSNNSLVPLQVLHHTISFYFFEIVQLSIDLSYKQAPFTLPPEWITLASDSLTCNSPARLILSGVPWPISFAHVTSVPRRRVNTEDRGSNLNLHG